jgi:threonine synthase
VRGVPIENPETVATAIRIGKPAPWQPALDAARDSGGVIIEVTD